MKKKLFSLVIVFTICSSSLCAQTDTVYIYEMSFEPSSLTIGKGAKVVWINRSDLDHTSTSGINCVKNGKWHSGYISKDHSFSHIFDTVGIYNYFCIPHCLSGMHGIITVKENVNPLNKNESLKKKENEVVQEENKGTQKRTPHFIGLDIINGVTANTLDKGILDFTIYHRFDDLIGKNGNQQLFFGLDNIRDLRFSFAYGLTKNITLGLGRCKGDWFIAPYQEIRNLYDGSIKIRICTQDTANKKFPFSIAVYSNTVYSAMEDQDIPGAESNFQYFSDRFSYSAQVIIARDFRKYLSLQLLPVYVRRNWVNINKGIRSDELDIFSLGAAARWGFSDRIAIVAEYYFVFSNYRQNNKDIFSNPLALGVEFNTGGHIFHINLTNATGIIPNTFIPYTTSSWLKNGFRLGFSISRKFILDKKSKKKTHNLLK